MVSTRNWKLNRGSEEINSLIGSFNQMIANLSTSELELQQTIKNLNQYTHYVEIVLKNVNAGVISVDMTGRLTTVNRRAGELLQIDSANSVGKHVRLLLSKENYTLFFSQTLGGKAYRRQRIFNFMRNSAGDLCPGGRPLSIYNGSHIIEDHNQTYFFIFFIL